MSSTLAKSHPNCIYSFKTSIKSGDDWDITFAKSVVQAIVMPKLHYCNTLLAGTPEYKVDRLLYFQNMSCRMVCNLCKYDHVSTSIKFLHWLNICERIACKIASLVYRCRNNQAPDYLADLLPKQRHNRNIRSSVSDNYTINHYRNQLISKSLFSSIGPQTWNTLLKLVTSSTTKDTFKNNLKTFLLGKSYG